jgi:hypothetical protein
MKRLFIIVLFFVVGCAQKIEEAWNRWKRDKQRNG